MTVLSVIAALGLLLGCSTSEEQNPVANVGTASAPERIDRVEPASGEPKLGGTIRVGLEAESDGFDPTRNRWANSAYMVGNAIFDPLVAIDEDFKPKPYLAESITPNADFTEWDITLRSGVKFHDGTALSAEGVAQSLRAVKGSALLSASMSAMTSATAVDSLTVRVAMSEPWSAFPYILASQPGYIASPKTISSPEGPRVPIGTGPFSFSSWEVDKQLVVKKNPDYWRSGMPYLDSVVYVPVVDSNVRLSSLKAGDIDLMTTALPSRGRQLDDEAATGALQVVHSSGDQDAQMILINTRQPPMDDIRVRQAIAYALDRNTFAAITETPAGLVASSLYSRDSRWYAELGDYYSYDVAKATALVDDYEREKGPVTFEFSSPSDPEAIKIVSALVEMFKAAGMDATSAVVEQSALILNAVTGKFVIQLWRQFGAPDPDMNMVWWLGSNADGAIAVNMARNQDPVLDAAMKTGRSTLDLAARKAEYDKVQERLKAELPYIWLAHVQWTMAANVKVRGIEHLILPDGSKSVGLTNGYYPWTGVWIE